jgi:ubiquinone/menaquinone biosynthesis C-methylase UbiE
LSEPSVPEAAAGQGDSTERFTDRVSLYLRFRPTYPRAVIDILRAEAALTPAAIVADVGSGTGLLSELLLENGNVVHAVEPNDQMRAAAEARLGHHARFHSVAGRAEATTLRDRTVDLVTAAQAFHWFDLHSTRREFARVLRPAGQVTLIWNRRLVTTPFGEAYEGLLRRFGTDYSEVRHDRITSDVLEEFYRGSFGRRSLSSSQRLEFEHLKGRLQSASYAPPPGHPDHEPMVRALSQLFDRHQTGGEVTMEYETEIFFGPLS